MLCNTVQRWERKGCRAGMQTSAKALECREMRKNGQGRIRTFEGISHQIYSLTRLAASVPTRIVSPRTSPPEAGVGFEPTTNGFAIRPLGPLGHPAAPQNGKGMWPCADRQRSRAFTRPAISVCVSRRGCTTAVPSFPDPEASPCTSTGEAARSMRSGMPPQRAASSQSASPSPPWECTSA